MALCKCWCTSEEVRAAKAYVEQARSLGMPVEFWDKQRLVERHRHRSLRGEPSSTPTADTSIP